MKQIPNTNNSIDIETSTIFFNNKEIHDSEGLYKLQLKNNCFILKNLNWIIHITKLNIELPSNFIDVVDLLYFLPQKPFGVSKDYEWIPLFKKPILVNEKFRLIPRFPNYAVSNDGEVYSLITNKLIKPEDVYVFGYKRVRLIDPMTNTQKIPSVHRLVGLAWCNNTDFIEFNIVDHKDGNKLNNFYKNLKWTSNSRNVSKKFNVYKGFKVENLDNGYVAIFNTIYEVSLFIGIKKIDLSRQPLTPYRIWKTINGNFKVSHNFKDTQNDRIHLKTKNRIKEVKNIITKEIKSFSITKELIEYTGVAKSTVIKYLDLGWDYKSINNWLIRYKTSSPWADDLKTMVAFEKPNIKVYVNHDGKVIHVFNSINEASKTLHLDNKTIKKRIKQKKSIIFNAKLCYLNSPL